MTLVASTGTLGFGYTPQRRIDWTSKGAIYALVYDPAIPRLRLLCSLDAGATWTQRTSWDYTGDASLFIANDDTLHILATKRGTGTQIYHMARLSSNHFNVTWQNAGVGLESKFAKGAVIAYKYGTATRAVVVGEDGTGDISYAEVTTYPGGDWTYRIEYDVITTQAGPSPRPSLDLHHTGDGKTPAGGTVAMWMSWTGDTDIFIRKRVGSSWGTTRIAHRSAALIRAAVFDGKRYVVAIPGATAGTIDLYERNASDTAGTTDTVSFPDGTPIDLDVAFDVNNDFHLGAVGNSSDPMIIRYDRSTTAWQSWVTLAAATGGALTMARRAYGHQLDVLYRTGTEARHVIGATLNHPPSQPTWLEPALDVGDVNAALRLAWRHNDADGDPQHSFLLTRLLNGATHWWNGSGWSTLAQWVTSSAQEISAPAGWAADGERPSFTLQTRDSSLDLSPSAQKTVLGSTKVNPTILAPTAGLIVEGSTLSIEWAVAEQSAWRIDVYDSGNNRTHTSLWQASSTQRTSGIGNLKNRETYTLRLRTRNNDGLDSDVAVVSFSVRYTPPPVALVDAAPDEAEPNALRVAWTNPEPRGNQPATVHVDLLKRIDDGPEKRILTGQPTNSSHLDYEVPSKLEDGGNKVTYVVEAFGANGATSRSDTAAVNLLTYHQSTAEQDDLGVAGLTAGPNTTIARDTTDPIEGEESWILTAVAAGEVEVITDPVSAEVGPVEIGEELIAVATVGDRSVLVEVSISLEQLDEDGTLQAAKPSGFVAQESLDVDAGAGVETLQLTQWATPERTGGTVLHGAGVSNDLYASVTRAEDLSTALQGVTRITSYIDGEQLANSPDATAPFDFNSGSVESAAPYDTWALANGDHTVSVFVERTIDGVNHDVWLSATITVANVPAPTNFQVTAGNTTATLSFVVPIHSPDLSVQIYRDGLEGDLLGPTQLATEGTTSTYTVQGLTNGIPVSFYLKAVEGTTGFESEATPTITVTPTEEPTAPETGNYLVEHVNPFESSAEFLQVQNWVAGGRYVSVGIGPDDGAGAVSNNFRGTWDEMVDGAAKLQTTKVAKITRFVTLDSSGNPTYNSVGNGKVAGGPKGDPDNINDPTAGNDISHRWNAIYALWAAYVGSHTNDNTLKARAARWAYNQATTPTFQMHEDYWNGNVNSDYSPTATDQKPLFGLANYWTMIVRIMMETGGQGLSAAEKEAVHLALARCAARYCFESHRANSKRLGSGRLDGNWKTTGLPNNGHEFGYDGSPRIYGVARGVNNRNMNGERLVAVIDVYFRWINYDPTATIAGTSKIFKPADYEREAKTGVKELLIFSTFPQGMQGDFERWTSGEPKKGLAYAMTTIAQPMTIMDLYARLGDRELVDFATSWGTDLVSGDIVLDKSSTSTTSNGSRGAIVNDANALLNGQGKSIHWLARLMAHYGTEHYVRTTPGGGSLDWDVAMSNGKYMGAEVLWWSAVNRIWGDTYISNLQTLIENRTYKNLEQGFRASVFHGDGHTEPSVLFTKFGHTSDPYVA